jgi:ribosomal protein L18
MAAELQKATPTCRRYLQTGLATYREAEDVKSHSNVQRGKYNKLKLWYTDEKTRIVIFCSNSNCTMQCHSSNVGKAVECVD